MTSFSVTSREGHCHEPYANEKVIIIIFVKRLDQTRIHFREIKTRLIVMAILHWLFIIGTVQGNELNYLKYSGIFEFTK